MGPWLSLGRTGQHPCECPWPILEGLVLNYSSQRRAVAASGRCPAASTDVEGFNCTWTGSHPGRLSPSAWRRGLGEGGPRFSINLQLEGPPGEEVPTRMGVSHPTGMLGLFLLPPIPAGMGGSTTPLPTQEERSLLTFSGADASHPERGGSRCKLRPGRPPQPPTSPPPRLTALRLRAGLAMPPTCRQMLVYDTPVCIIRGMEPALAPRLLCAEDTQVPRSDVTCAR